MATTNNQAETVEELVDKYATTDMDILEFEERLEDALMNEEYPEMNDTETTSNTDARPMIRPHDYQRNTDFGHGFASGRDLSDDPVEATATAFSDTEANDADGDRRLQFATSMLDPETAAECVEQIGRYNAFDPDALADFLRNELAGRGYAAVGREGSPVLYLYTTMPVDDLLDLLEVTIRSHDAPSDSGIFQPGMPDEVQVNPTADSYPEGDFVWHKDFDGVPADDHVVVRLWWD